MVDRLLDQVLNREPILDSDVKEGEFSALVSKIIRVQRVLDGYAAQAETEKEQIKRLVSDMSHQLKTPLANLAVYTEILSGAEVPAAKRDAFAEKMCKQVDKLNWMVGSLSKMIKLERGITLFAMTELPLRQTIMDAVDCVYEKSEKKGIRLFLEPFEDRLLFHNRKWTVEVLVNLLENAVKYTSEGGMVQIRVCPYEIYTEIQIADNGRGIRKEELTEIFQRFYRSRDVENMEGSGLGLYLSRLILEEEKGYLTVASAYGEGSCFSVFLQNCKK